MKTPLIIAGALLAGFVYLRTRQTAAPEVIDPYSMDAWAGVTGDPYAGQAPIEPERSTLGSVAELLNPWTYIAGYAAQGKVTQSMEETNVQAFLSLIRYAEGTDRRADPYRVTYGYSHTIQDLSDHPVVTGEWSGKTLPDAMCRGAGFGPGCISTAAGAYQFLSSTWKTCQRALGLPDFGPESQDRAAIYLIERRGALDDVRSGRIAEALQKCRREWASLPGAGYGQGERSLDSLLARFEQAGGMLA